VTCALISDIHANTPALEAVLADIAKRKEVTATYHLGDLVGYAPWPDELVTMLRKPLGEDELQHRRIQRCAINGVASKRNIECAL